jgi:single-strand DNA-binding protein
MQAVLGGKMIMRTAGGAMVVNHLNSVLLEGDLVKDAVYRKTEAGTARYDFTLASSRVLKNTGQGILEKEVSFFEVVAYGELVERCRVEARQGRSVRVVGRLAQERRQRADGGQESRVYVIAEHIEFRAGITTDAELPDDAA